MEGEFNSIFGLDEQLVRPPKLTFALTLYVSPSLTDTDADLGVPVDGFLKDTVISSVPDPFATLNRAVQVAPDGTPPE
jgi:hypothetical protein